MSVYTGLGKSMDTTISFLMTTPENPDYYSVYSIKVHIFFVGLPIFSNKKMSCFGGSLTFLKVKPHK